jgi:hypothetical protein
VIVEAFAAGGGRREAGALDLAEPHGTVKMRLDEEQRRLDLTDPGEDRPAGEVALEAEEVRAEGEARPELTQVGRDRAHRRADLLGHRARGPSLDAHDVAVVARVAHDRISFRCSVKR